VLIDIPGGEWWCIWCDVVPLLLNGAGLGVGGVVGGSKISLYFDTMSTEIKYTIAKDKNWACFVSSCKHQINKIC
jgi:hypothetical protein